MTKQIYSYLLLYFSLHYIYIYIFLYILLTLQLQGSYFILALEHPFWEADDLYECFLQHCFVRIAVLLVLTDTYIC